jgi:hypothetical protein
LPPSKSASFSIRSCRMEEKRAQRHRLISGPREFRDLRKAEN